MDSEEMKEQASVEQEEDDIEVLPLNKDEEEKMEVVSEYEISINIKEIRSKKRFRRNIDKVEYDLEVEPVKEKMKERGQRKVEKKAD